MRQRLQEIYRRHQGFLLLFLLFVALRVMALILLRSDATDFDFYYAWGQLTSMAHVPFVDMWAAYPPLFPALMLPVYELASRIPPWIEPRFFFDLLFGLWLLVFEAGNLMLIYRLGGRLENEESETRNGERVGWDAPGLAGAAIYALLFAPLHVMLGWFEPMPLFFLLLGLELLLIERPWGWTGSAVAAALGTLIKLTPLLLVPVAVRRLGARLSLTAARDEWFKRKSSGNLLRPLLYLLIYLAVTVGLGLWLAHGNGGLAVSSLKVNAMRAPWQSVWALIDGYYGYGLVPVDMRNLVGLETRQWQGNVPWPAVTLIFLGLYLWLYTRRYDWRAIRTPIAFTGVSIIWLFLYSKGWSPQFLIWILAFTVILTPTFWGACLAIALSLINIVESTVFLTMLPDEHWILFGTVILRTFLLILLAGEFLGQIWPNPVAGRRLGRASRNLAWGAMLAGLVAGVIMTPRAGQAYDARRLAEHPCAPAIEFLRAAEEGPETILMQDVTLWQDLYPWLRRAYTLRVIDSYSSVDEPPADVVAGTLDDLLRDGRAVWWIQGEESSLAEQGYFTRADVHQFEEQALGACSLRQIVRLDQAAPLATAASGPIRLLAADTNAEKNALDVVLYWQADGPVAESYTVFVQLFDAAGKMLAQQDNLPVNGLAPTDTWTPGTVIRDAYRLTPSADLAPGGTYELYVGLYNDAGRQTLILADGQPSDYVALPVALEQE
ncbi:MAG: hypothetical protein H6642_08145 [Caldilineaceae bacterium]|nr:hypothetical protein [Caldilineaceae bacterium]